MTKAATATADDDNFDTAFDQFTGAAPLKDAATDTGGDEDTMGSDDDREGADAALNDGEGADRQAAAATEEDPLSGLPEDVRQRIAEAEAALKAEKLRAEAAEHAARSNAGRVSALQRQVDELKKSPRTDKAGADDKGPGAETDTDDGSFGEEYREVADFVKRTVEEKVAPIVAELDEKKTEEQVRQATAELTQAFERLAQAHPDFDQIRNDPKYGEWLNAQPPGIRNLAASENPDDAIALCNLYKQGKGPARTTSRDDLLAAAEEIPSKGGSRKTGVADDFDAAFDHFANSRTR